MTWRERRKLSFLINEFNDVNLPYKVQPNYTDDEIAEETIKFFESGSELIYPAKSYFVAIVYAKMLEEYFGIPFVEALGYQDLLIKDDWFKPYGEARHIYDSILKKIPTDFLKMESTIKTQGYFREEFLIGTDC